MIETKNKPYFDDFDISKNFLKVLFKPSVSVQTRELNQLQSIIQNQIGTLSDSIYKDGSVVKDGRLIFKNDVDYIKLKSSYLSDSFDYSRFQGRKLYGSTTEIVASVFDGFNETTTNPATLYFNYLSSGINQEKTFQESEVLKLCNYIYVTDIDGTFTINETIVGQTSGATAKLLLLENNRITLVYLTATRFLANELLIGSSSSSEAIYSYGETDQYMCQVQSSIDIDSPIGFGSFVLVSSGIYYINNYFVNVNPQQIILSEYGTLVSAKVGFNKETVFIDATEDNSLYDNANGTPNENAPGADRLSINLALGYFNLFEDVPDQFVEILRINNSNIIFNNSTDSTWSNLIDLLAKRTYDESGNYTVKPFIVDIQEFLNEDSNNGIYDESFFGFSTVQEALNSSIEMFGETYPGTSHLYQYKYYPLTSHNAFLQAARDRVCLGINSGLAYVFGYEVDLANRIYVPMKKARDLGVANNSIVNINYGNYCLVDNLYNLPNIYQLEKVILTDNATFNASNEIGTARIRMIIHESGTYGSSTEVFRVYLSDIEMNTGKSFSSDVKSMGIDVGNGFNAQSVLDTYGKFNLYDIDKNINIFNLPQNAVQSLDNVSYAYELVTQGTVDATGKITISAPSNSLFYSLEPQKYLLTMTSGANLGQIVNIQGLIALLGNPSGSTLEIDLSSGSGYASETFTLISSVYRTSNNLKTKTLVNNAEYNVVSPTDSIIVPNADGYKLLGVYDSGNPATPATTSSTNITSNYVFDGGQRDDWYDLIQLNKIPNTQDPSGQLLIVYSYFTHSSGDYFSAESYSGQLDYEDTPIYISESGINYDLKNCIDFRPRIDNDGDGFTSISNPRILTPGLNFQSNTSYYLPRIDLLEVDYMGNFKIKSGTSAINPQAPVGDLNAMVLYYFEIPSYTQNINDIVKKYQENKRYTMRDIGLIENRVIAMENYILLNQNEYDITNMPIFGSDGTERYKVGYIADNFLDHSYGDIISVNYRCAIDVTQNFLRPSFKLRSVVLEKNSALTSTVVEENGKYMIPKTDVTNISQTVGTSIQRMNENGIVSWMGNLLINPSVNNVYNNINQSRQNFGDDSNYLNDFNTILEDSDNQLEYGNFFLNWLGV